MPAKPPTLTSSSLAQLVEFGERLRRARLRRNLTATAVAEMAGITRATLDRAELGQAAVTFGTYLSVLKVLGLDAEIDRLAGNDKAAEGEALPLRRQGTSAPRRIFLRKYPQLRQIAWSREDDEENPASIGPTEAFQLYERNWRHVDAESMTPEEAQLVERLTQTIGKGVLLV